MWLVQEADGGCLRPILHAGQRLRPSHAPATKRFWHLPASRFGPLGEPAIRGHWATPVGHPLAQPGQQGLSRLHPVPRRAAGSLNLFCVLPIIVPHIVCMLVPGSGSSTSFIPLLSPAFLPCGCGSTLDGCCTMRCMYTRFKVERSEAEVGGMCLRRKKGHAARG